MDLSKLQQIDPYSWSVPLHVGEKRAPVRLFGSAPLQGANRGHRAKTRNGLASRAQRLGQRVPTVVDKLTPDGTVPEGGMLEKGLAILKELASKT